MGQQNGMMCEDLGVAFFLPTLCFLYSSKVGLVTSLSNVEKQFILDIPTKSKTLTTKEPSVFQKTLVLNKEPATEETRLLKKTLQSRACHQKTFLVEKPLNLVEETEDYNEFDAEPMITSKREKKPEEADVTEKVVSLGNPIFFFFEINVFRNAASPEGIVWERLKFS